MTAPAEPSERAAMKRAGDDMDLPAGKTCADCYHFKRCNAIYGHIAADEVCDWAPSRFVQRAIEKALGALSGGD